MLDVGCGPGRHSRALATRGIAVVGVDIAERFVEIAARSRTTGSAFVRADAGALPVTTGFDAAISLCQGAFGLGGPGTPPEALAPDRTILAEMARATRPGGAVAVTAFSSYFQVRFLEETDRFDAGSGVNHETTVVRDESGVETTHDLWTTCFTPRELRLLAHEAGLAVRGVWSVAPGHYGRHPAHLQSPEFLMIAGVTEQGARW